MSEQSIATPEQQALIHEILQKLSKTVSENINQVSDNGLLSGLAGQLLFLFNAHKINTAFVNEDIFANKLEQLQSQLDQQSLELSSGLAGQAWLLEYFNQADMSDYDAELLDDVDHLFLRALNHQPWSGEIEFVLGLAGYAPYIARRSKCTDQTALIKVLVDNYSSVATWLENGQVCWSQPPGSVYRFDTSTPSKPEYNLGLAHGVPSVIAALLPALQVEELKDSVTKLLLASCDWLLAQQNPDQDDLCCFGSVVGSDYRSRLGWCYGDLAIALLIARVATALDRPSLMERAQYIALKTTQRDVVNGAINDAGLCHGFVGLVSMYQLLYQLIPHPDLKQAAQYWLDYTLEQYLLHGLEAFYAFNGDTRAGYEEYGLLMGYAGVGLGLTAVLNDDLEWAECLLMK